MAFTSTLDVSTDVALITLVGELDAAAAASFRDEIEKAAEKHPQRLVLQMQDLTYMASAGLRALIFAKQKMGPAVDIVLVATQPPVMETIRLTGFNNSVVFMDTWNA